MPNRLAAEQSPYLLQHKDNPVDWYPWGGEAFARARDEDKLIFLSIGYSTCHWCHVMEHESFENPQIADVLNRHFVSIKVDREERPDVDRVYMTFVQATTGSGGWPMSVWLTPALEPFYGGTYFPPASRWGRPGFIEVLTEIARAWRDDRLKVVQSASTIVGRLRELGGSKTGGGIPGTNVLDATVREFAASFDSARGGFGNQPKFPRPSELLFLLREQFRLRASRFGETSPSGGSRFGETSPSGGSRFGETSPSGASRFGETSPSGASRFGETRPPEPLSPSPGGTITGPVDMVLTTLRAMALGGMRDHIGGGFHRYSVDANWRVPHFEKMLYDQAQLVIAFVEAAQASGDRFFSDVALDTLNYVRRDMTDPAGGFYSAEDADSIPPEEAGDPAAHKMEGAFYIWRDDEIGAVLGVDAAVFRARFGILPDGNAPFDPQNEFTHKNLLYTAKDLDDVARETGSSPDAVAASLERSRRVLLDVRSRRPRPHLDDKVLTAWNGLMIAAFARAGRTIEGASNYIADARRAARFLQTRMWNPSARSLLRRYRQGETGIDAYAEDYAYLIFGLLELFQADGDPGWLEWAIDLQRRQDELFWDDDEGGWYSTTGTDPSVLLRMKEDYDGAEPSASSVSLLNLLTLTHLAADPTFSDRLERTLGAFASGAARTGRAVPMLMAALSTYHTGVTQVVVAGSHDLSWPLIDVIRRRYLPNVLVVPLEPVHREQVARVLPWTATMIPTAGSAAAYVCRNFACERPVTTPQALESQLLHWQ